MVYLLGPPVFEIFGTSPPQFNGTWTRFIGAAANKICTEQPLSIQSVCVCVRVSFLRSKLHVFFIKTVVFSMNIVSPIKKL